MSYEDKPAKRVLSRIDELRQPSQISNSDLMRFFDTSVIQPPTRTNPGNAAPGVVRGPAVEECAVQFRIETFNTFNHPQFNTVNTNPQFDQNGNQVNGLLGQITADYLPRQVQLVMKVMF